MGLAHQMFGLHNRTIPWLFGVWLASLLVAYALKHEYGTKGADSLLLGVPPLVYRLSPLVSSTPCLHITQAHYD